MVSPELPSGNEPHRPESLLSIAAQHPGYVIPFVGLFCYLVAANYLDGYLSLFSAKAHWFDPGIFRLIAFARNPLIISLLIVLLWVRLNQKLSNNLISWLPMYVLYGCVYIILIAGAEVSSIIYNVDRYPFAVWEGLIIIVATLVMLLCARFVVLKLLRRQASHSQAGSMSARIADRLKASINKIDSRSVNVVFLLSILVMYLAISSQIGTISAVLDRARVQKEAAEKGSEASKIVFTDGSFTLIYKDGGERNHKLFCSADGQVIAELFTPTDLMFMKLDSQKKKIEQILKDSNDAQARAANGEITVEQFSETMEKLTALLDDLNKQGAASGRRHASSRPSR
jgi:hypothetical protein